MKIFIHDTPLPQKFKKNNFEDFNKPFLLVKDTFKNTFKKTMKEKYEEKILEKISNLDDSSKLFLNSKFKNRH